MQCASCGAQIGPEDIQCPYCSAMTPFGLQRDYLMAQQSAHLAMLQQQQANAEAFERQQAATRDAKKSAKLALGFGIAGVILCCVFIPSVLGIVFGVRSRRLARQHGLPQLSSALAGLVLGWLGIAAGIGTITLGVVQDVSRSNRIAELDKRLASTATQSTLTHQTACMLAERRLLQGAFRGEKNIDSVECLGALSFSSQGATLSTLRFRLSSNEHTLRVCLEKGTSWYVAGFRTNASCQEPDDTGANKSSNSAGKR